MNLEANIDFEKLMDNYVSATYIYENNDLYALEKGICQYMFDYNTVISYATLREFLKKEYLFNKNSTASDYILDELSYNSLIEHLEKSILFDKTTNIKQKNSQNVVWGIKLSDTYFDYIGKVYDSTLFKKLLKNIDSVKSINNFYTYLDYLFKKDNKLYLDVLNIVSEEPNDFILFLIYILKPFKSFTHRVAKNGKDVLRALEEGVRDYKKYIDTCDNELLKGVKETNNTVDLKEKDVSKEKTLLESINDLLYIFNKETKDLDRLSFAKYYSDKKEVEQKIINFLEEIKGDI